MVEKEPTQANGTLTENRAQTIASPDEKPSKSDGHDPFADPRRHRDRRKKHDASRIPKIGCRRLGDRRTTVYLTSDGWWMKRNYNNSI